MFNKDCFIRVAFVFLLVYDAYAAAKLISGNFRIDITD